MHAMKGVLLTVLSLMWLAPGLQSVQKPLKAGEDGQGPWWMKQTAIKSDGSMASLKTKSWWGKARHLKVGESFVVDRRARPRTGCSSGASAFNDPLRERSVEAIVWVIDDDGDGSVRQGRRQGLRLLRRRLRRRRRRRSDGRLHRQRRRQRSRRDGHPLLRRRPAQLLPGSAWTSTTTARCGTCRGYEYGGDELFRERPVRRQHDLHEQVQPGRGDLVADLRMPVRVLRHRRRRLQRGGRPGQRRAAGLRSGARIPTTPTPPTTAPWEHGDGADGRGQHPLQLRHRQPAAARNARSTTTSGSTWSARCPTTYPGMYHFNPHAPAAADDRASSPGTTCGPSPTPTRPGRPASPGTRTVDDTIAIGYGRRTRTTTSAGKGVFWIWERRFMENTGGPCQKWNVRREWSSKPTDQPRALLQRRRRPRSTCSAPRRAGSRSAISAGWAGSARSACSTPTATATSTAGRSTARESERPGPGDHGARRAGPARSSSTRTTCTGPMLGRSCPKAMAANEKLMQAMAGVLPFELPEGLKKAMATGPDELPPLRPGRGPGAAVRRT